MGLHNFGYLFRQGAKSIFSNRLMSLACIGVLVACLLLIGGAAIATMTINNFVREVEQQNEIVAYLDTSLARRDVEAVDVAIRSTGNIVEYTFIPKDEGLEHIKGRMDDYSDLLVGLEGTENPLPDKYILRLDDSSRIEETIADVMNIEGVDKVSASIEVAQTLTAIKTTVFYTGAVVIAILLVVSLVIITNTIKLTVLSRSREINIMKYVGATDAFIRLPFLVEGTLLGLIAAVLAFLLLGFCYTYLLGWAENNYGQYFGMLLSNAVDFGSIALYMIGVFSAIGIVIGSLSSIVFVRKHLRV